MRVVCIVHEILDGSGPINALSPIVLAFKGYPDDSLSIISLTYSPFSACFREYCGDGIEIQAPRSNLCHRIIWPFYILLKLLVAKPDIVQSHLLLPNAFALLAKLAGLPSRVVCTIHNKEDYMYKRIPFGSMWFLAQVERRLAFAADSIVAVSNSLSEYLRRDYLSHHSEKIVAIPNGIDTDKYIFNLSDRDMIRSRYHISKDDIVIGAVGRLIERKNYHFLLRALRHLANITSFPIKLLVVGEGPERDKLLELAHRLNISSEVEFVGHTTEIQRFYSAFDLFVHPSTAEGFGLSILEAMSCYLPCVAFDIEGPRDLVIDGETGYLCPAQSSLDFSRTLASLISDADLLQKMSLKAREVAVSCYDITYVSTVYYSFFSKLAKTSVFRKEVTPLISTSESLKTCSGRR